MKRENEYTPNPNKTEPQYLCFCFYKKLKHFKVLYGREGRSIRHTYTDHEELQVDDYHGNGYALFLRIKTISYLTPTRSGSSKIYMSTTLPWWKYIVFINQSSCLFIISTIACYKKKMLIIINKTQHIIRRTKEIVKVGKKLAFSPFKKTI